jgi:hypothetical protein
MRDCVDKAVLSAAGDQSRQGLNERAELTTLIKTLIVGISWTSLRGRSAGWY